MTRYTIKLDRENCIGCGSCATLCPDNWEINADDGKSDFKDAELDELGCNMEAAEACPANVIHIIDEDTGDKII
jgi:ferredoxin